MEEKEVETDTQRQGAQGSATTLGQFLRSLVFLAVVIAALVVLVAACVRAVLLLALRLRHSSGS
ncbi:MAG: hypothetical protein U1F68_17475 [Gammaproteobacteria bacterium]